MGTRNIIVKIDTELWNQLQAALTLHNAHADIRLDKSKLMRQAIIQFIRKTNKKY